MKINGRRIAGVIFDIDGTLVDSFPVFSRIFNESVKPYLFEEVPEAFLADCLRKGLDLVAILRDISPSNTDSAFIERYRREIMELFLKVEAEEVKLLPGVIKLFSSLRGRNVKLGIATGRTSPPEKEWERFKRFGLDAYLDAIVTSREVARRKPAPDALLECAKRLNVPIETCLAVGDTEIDILAAREAGAIPVAVSTGYDSIDLLKQKQENPGLVFKDLFDFSFFLDHLEETGTKGGG
jgi:HAD superfamily hydrolase (TIGR01549 family)